MTELEKLDAGLPFSIRDEAVHARKMRAVVGYRKLNAVDTNDAEKLTKAIQELFGSAGENPFVAPIFNCDYGLNNSCWRLFPG